MRVLMMMTAIAALAACSQEPKEPSQREQIGQTWKYEGGEGDKARVAYIGSTNIVATMTAPDTFGVLLVQPMSNGEKTVTIKLVGAPFQCDLSDCAVTARGDDGKRYRWKGRMSDAKDGIEIMPSQNAYEAIARAKTVTVDLTVGPRDKTASFQFNVAGLVLPG